VEDEGTGTERARVTELLLSPVAGDDTTQLLAMAKQCLDRLHAARIDQRLAELQKGIAAMTGEQKMAAMQEFRELTQQRQRLKIN